MSIYQNWKRSVFIPKLRKGSDKECSNYCIIALISYASKVILKILQAGFRQGRGTRDQIASKHLIIDKARIPEKISVFIDSAKAFDCRSQQTGKFFERWEYQTNLPAS